MGLFAREGFESVGPGHQRKSERKQPSGRKKQIEGARPRRGGGGGDNILFMVIQAAVSLVPLSHDSGQNIQTLSKSD